MHRAGFWWGPDVYFHNCWSRRQWHWCLWEAESFLGTWSFREYTQKSEGRDFRTSVSFALDFVLGWNASAAQLFCQAQQSPAPPAWFHFTRSLNAKECVLGGVEYYPIALEWAVSFAGWHLCEEIWWHLQRAGASVLFVESLLKDAGVCFSGIFWPWTFYGTNSREFWKYWVKREELL